MADEKKEIFDENNKFVSYFKEDLEKLNSELEKAEKYNEMMEKEIDIFSSQGRTAGGIQTRGSQHYLIEHFKNLISLQSQKQGILKDRVALKKIVMDYIQKTESSGDFEGFQREINKLIEENKKNGLTKEKNFSFQNEENPEMDDEIEKIIKENKNDD